MARWQDAPIIEAAPPQARWQDAPIIEDAAPQAATGRMRWQDAPVIEEVAAPSNVQPGVSVAAPTEVTPDVSLVRPSERVRKIQSLMLPNESATGPSGRTLIPLPPGTRSDLVDTVYPVQPAPANPEDALRPTVLHSPSERTPTENIAYNIVYGNQSHFQGVDASNFEAYVGRLEDKQRAAVTPVEPGNIGAQIPAPVPIQPGNINLSNRPRVQNPDGSISTVRSIGIGIDGGRQVVIPTVVGGRVVSNQEAFDHYRRTGEHLGVFANVEDANRFAQSLHDQEAARIAAPIPAAPAVRPTTVAKGTPTPTTAVDRPWSPELRVAVWDYARQLATGQSTVPEAQRAGDVAWMASQPNFLAPRAEYGTALNLVRAAPLGAVQAVAGGIAGGLHVAGTLHIAGAHEAGQALNEDQARMAANLVPGGGPVAGYAADVLHSLGAVGGYALTEAATGPLGLYATFTASGYGTGYEDAKRAGASDTAAMLSGLSNGIVSAASIPLLGKLLGPLNRRVGNGLGGATLQGGIDSLTFGLMTALQTGGGHLIAKQLYDENRDVVESTIDTLKATGKSGVAGFILGLIKFVALHGRVPPIVARADIIKRTPPPITPLPVAEEVRLAPTTVQDREAIIRRFGKPAPAEQPAESIAPEVGANAPEVRPTEPAPAPRAAAPAPAAAEPARSVGEPTPKTTAQLAEEAQGQRGRDNLASVRGAMKYRREGPLDVADFERRLLSAKTVAEVGGLVRELEGQLGESLYIPEIAAIRGLWEAHRAGLPHESLTGPAAPAPTPPAAQEVAPAPSAPQRQPWEMRRAEYYDLVGHAEEVRDAVTDGKPVPPEVLRDYAGESWADAALAAKPGAGEAPAPAQGEQGVRAQGAQSNAPGAQAEKPKSPFKMRKEPDGTHSVIDTRTGEVAVSGKALGEARKEMATRNRQANQRAKDESRAAQLEQEIGDRIQGKGPNGEELRGMGLPLDTPTLAKAAELGYLYVKMGAQDFATWSKKMLARFGEPIRPHLRGIYERVRAMPEAKPFKMDTPPTGLPAARKTVFGQIKPPEGSPEPPRVATPPLRPDAEPLVGIKNETIDELFREAGLNPPLHGPKINSPEENTWAERTLARDPDIGRRIATEVSESPRQLTVQEEIILTRELDRLTIERERLAEEGAGIVAAGGDVSVIKAQMARIETEYNTLGQATTLGGTLWGQVGRVRQIMMRNYSFLYQARVQSIAKGRPLYERERTKLEAQTTRNAKLEKKIAELAARNIALEEDRALQDANIKAHQELLKETAAKPRSRARSANRIVTKESYDAAVKEFQLAMSQPGLVLGPRAIVPLTKIGLYHLERTARDVAAWTRAMLEDPNIKPYGAKIRPHLQAIWNAARKQLDVATREQITEQLRENMGEDGSPQRIPGLVEELHRGFIRDGMRNRDDVIDAIHAVLKTIDREITRRNVMELMTKYGKRQPLSQDEIEVERRRIRGEILQVLHLEDVTQGKPVPHTGREQPTPGDEQRRLTKLVNEEMRRSGYSTTDPTKVKGPLDAIKTQRRNEISDIEDQLAVRERFLKTKTPVTEDAESVRLKKHLDMLREQFHEMFEKPGLTDEQRINLAIRAAERSLAEYQRLIESGTYSDLFPGKKNRGPTSEALEAIQARRDAAQAELEELRTFVSPNRTPEERAIKASLRRKAKRIAELTEMLATGNFEKAPRPTPRVPTKEEVKLQVEQAILQRRIDNARMHPLDRVARFLEELGGLWRTTIASGDISYSLWQLRPLAYREIGEFLGGGGKYSQHVWGRAVAKQARAFVSKEVYDRTMAEYQASPYWGEMGRQSLTTRAGPDVPWKEHEESFPRRLVRRWPLAEQGERAAVIAGTGARLALYEQLWPLWERMGWLKDAKGKRLLAGVIGRATGRQPLPKARVIQELARLINACLFSARLRYGNIINVSTLFGTLRLHPGIRAEGAKQLSGALATIVIATAAVRLLWPDDELETDPRSSDFMTVPVGVGNTRYSLLGPLQPLLVAVARAATGTAKRADGSFHDVGRLKVLTDYLESGKAPLVGIILRLWTGKTWDNKTIEGIAGWVGVARESMVYMWLNDAVDAFADELKQSGLGNALLGGGAAGLASWTGAGVRTSERGPKRDYPQTPAIRRMDQLLDARPREGGDITQADRDNAKRRKEIATNLRNDIITVDEAREQLAALGARVEQFRSLVHDAQKDPRVIAFMRLSVEEAQAVFALANQEEQDLWEVPLQIKEANAAENPQLEQ